MALQATPQPHWEWTVFRSNWWGFVLLAVHLLGWCALGLLSQSGLSLTVLLALAVLHGLLGLQAFWFWHRSPFRVLGWGPQGWCHDGAALQYVAIDGDWQQMLLLRLVFPHGRWRWVVLQASWYSPQQWHHLRTLLILHSKHA